MVKMGIKYIQQFTEYNYLNNYIQKMLKNPNGRRSIGINIVGPPGIGKTLLGVCLAQEFGHEHIPIDGSPTLERRDIEGIYEVRDGNTIFIKAQLVRAIEQANETGISFLSIEEVNAIPPEEQISLNSLLDFKGEISLLSKAGEKYRINDGCMVVVLSTMNRNVFGINPLQQAFKSRYDLFIELDFPSIQKETEILQIITKIDNHSAREISETARELRQMCEKDNKISDLITTRCLVKLCKINKEMGKTMVKETMEYCIINKITSTPQERQLVFNLLEGKMLRRTLENAVYDGEIIPKKEEHKKEEIGKHRSKWYIEKLPAHLEILSMNEKSVKLYNKFLGTSEVLLVQKGTRKTSDYTLRHYSHGGQIQLALVRKEKGTTYVVFLGKTISPSDTTSKL